MTSVTPQKRRTADNASGTSTDGSRSAKRSRRSRWDSEKPHDDAVERPCVTPTRTPSKHALSDIVKKLSSVVKEKSTTQLHSTLGPGMQAIVSPPASSPEVVDAETAKAKALAQASLLAMNLPAAQTSVSDVARRLYIGNLYYELKEDDIRNVFAPFGGIRSIDLSMEPGCGRSKGFCFLEYDDVLAAESAVQVLNGSQLANRSIKVGRPLRGNASDATQALSIGQQAIKHIRTKCLYVGNVRIELNSHHLESIFAPFGEIHACVMTSISPLEPGMHRGYGFIEYANEASAMNAAQHMNGFELAGQHLKVGKASPAAILINLATSKDKIVRGSHLTAVAGVQTTLTPSKKSTLDGDEDYEGESARKRCIGLLNLVKKGQVDGELEREVRMECSKFGSVEHVEIAQLPDHVRVFVVFNDEVSAEKARGALNGRFFGGNQVQAHYYPLHQLRRKHCDGAFL